jgi:hypothetical protein
MSLDISHLIVKSSRPYTEGIKEITTDEFLCHKILIEQTKTKLRGFSPQETIPSDRLPLVSEVSGNFCG